MAVIVEAVTHNSLLFTVMSLLLHHIICEGYIRELPLTSDLKNCYFGTKSYAHVTPAWSAYSSCESMYHHVRHNRTTQLLPDQIRYYNNLLTKIVSPSLIGSGSQDIKCVRKEYRMLTDEERNKFHAAVNALKKDNSVKPNKFDSIAAYHSEENLLRGHKGPGFLGWHRIFVLMFEHALQEKDPSVCVPYWASSLDSALSDPTHSPMFSDLFIGNGDGDVRTGPFAGWKTQPGTNLTRNVGVDGVLISRHIIDAILARPNQSDIVYPSEAFYTIEYHHNFIHDFIGGDMSKLPTAPFDPIFYLHHAFMDFIWEMYREKMRERNLDPEIYPNISSSFYHFPESIMGFNDFLTQSQGYLNVMYHTYEYAPYPACSKQLPYCNSKYLQCDVHTETCLPVSVPRTRGNLDQDACHDDKCSSEPSTPSLQPIQPACSPPNNTPCQNNFCIQANCDVTQWVWMQVRIIGQRSSIFQDGRSDPVQDWIAQNQFNMYNSFVNSKAKRHISQGKDNFDRYNSCSTTDGVGKIFVMSFGLNYDGIFKDFTFMDQHQAVSLAMGFVAVKDPGVNETTKVILRAYDSCGRLCRTTCRVPKSDPPRYKACSGIVEVTSEFPRQFGQTYAEAMLNTFVYSSNSDSPDVKFDDVFITFFCDYN